VSSDRDLDQWHPLSRGEKMQPEEAGWIGERPREPANGEPGGVTCNNCIRRRPLDVREDGVLQGAVFRHAFDDEIAFAQTIDDRRRLHPQEDRRPVVGGEPAAGHLP
jgi:hypothetical protein